MPTNGGKYIKKTRRRYDREFKISVVAELESGKPLAQIAREYGIDPSVFPAPGGMSWPRTPKEHSAAMATIGLNEARIAELERLLGQAHAENELSKKRSP
jgi:transposase